jgi:phage protein D
MDIANVLGVVTSASSPTLRRPTFEIDVGSGGAEAWKGATASIRVRLGLAPSVNSAEIVLAFADAAPSVAVGDSGTIALGYEDGQTITAFTGSVESVRSAVDGRTRILMVDAGATLARFRANSSYEGQRADDVIRDLAARAGVQVGNIQSGIDLAFYAIDDSTGAYEIIAFLARRSGCCASITADGELKVETVSSDPPLRSFSYGEDIIACRAAERAPIVGTVTVIGEGAAGKQGQDAWCWLAKDPGQDTSSAGSSDPELRISEPCLRSAQAAQDASQSALDAASLSAVSGRLTVPGSPDLACGVGLQVTSTPGGALDGTYFAERVTHFLSKARGFVTEIDVRRPA